MPTTIAAWRAALEAGDAEAAGACLAQDAVFISPLTEKFRFHGREQITDVLRSAVEVFDDVRFHTEVGDGPTYALFLHCRAGRQSVEEAQLVRLDDAGLIGELTFFGRPLPALTATMVGAGPPDDAPPEQARARPADRNGGASAGRADAVRREADRAARRPEPGAPDGPLTTALPSSYAGGLASPHG